MENQTTPAASLPKLMPIEELFKKSFSLYWPKAFSMLFLFLICWLAFIIIVAVFGGLAMLLTIQEVTVLNWVAGLSVIVGALLAIIVGLWIQTALLFAVREPQGSLNIKKLL